MTTMGKRIDDLTGTVEDLQLYSGYETAEEEPGEPTPSSDSDDDDRTWQEKYLPDLLVVPYIIVVKGIPYGVRSGWNRLWK